jgi:hypothetical protein
MKKFILFIFLAAIAIQGSSQKIYFAYLQTEAGQPFFVRMNDKVFSSSSSGYLILSRLHDSTYTIYLGFPGQSTEQKFSIPINHKDKGYLVKDFGAQGWGLFDLQSLTVQMAQNAGSGVKTVPDDNVSPFTEILSKAADDPSLKEKTVVEVVKKTDPVIPAVQKEEVAVPVSKTTDPVVEKTVTPAVSSSGDEVVKKEEKTGDVKKEEIKAGEPVKEPVEVKKESEVTVKTASNTKSEEDKNQVSSSEVVKLSESAGSEGHEVVYLDKSGSGRSDTIRLQIPNQKIAEKPVEDSRPVEKKFLDIPVEPAKDNTPKNETKQEPVKTVAEEKAVVKETETPKVNEPVKESVTEEPVKKAVAPAACTETAGESDFIRLRRKMVATDDDDGMIAEARRGFKSQCFTVYQIRNLSTLFLTDEGKYRFFDTAYPYASDAHNFISLKLELKEGYWVKRFEAMLK